MNQAPNIPVPQTLPCKFLHQKDRKQFIYYLRTPLLYKLIYRWISKRKYPALHHAILQNYDPQLNNQYQSSLIQYFYYKYS